MMIVSIKRKMRTRSVIMTRQAPTVKLLIMIIVVRLTTVGKYRIKCSEYGGRGARP